ncbi:glucosaminidase domain-containing protein [Gaetbulibacter sp. M235]|uniref:glucosaminidase domain-containing protein n=1 Tax=Gaetbulibacter sp. M235 TaxID=3126510 RepID=UPI00374F4604
MIKKIVMFLFLGMFIFSCGSKKSVARKHKSTKTKTEHVVLAETPKDTQVANNEEPATIEPLKISSTEEYLERFSAIAQEEMRLYGIPASITLAQGILESNSGRGRLSIEANNHFGIKCHDWTGAKIYHDDDALQECFRKYNDAKYSYRDHSLFLTNRKRYSKLFDLDKDDYKAWAKELKAAGYATDRHYPSKLISLIERYELYKLDDEVLGDKNKRKSKAPKTVIEDTVYEVEDADVIGDNSEKNDSSVSNNQGQEIKANTVTGSNTYTVEKGDTLYSISKKFNTTVSELQDMNGLTDNSISLGQKLKVKPVVENNNNTYVVEQGDTLYSISKKHNTTVQELQQLNNLKGTTVSIGQVLQIK